MRKNTVVNVENISRKVKDVVDYEIYKVQLGMGHKPELNNAKSAIEIELNRAKGYNMNRNMSQNNVFKLAPLTKPPMGSSYLRMKKSMDPNYAESEDEFVIPRTDRGDVS